MKQHFNLKPNFFQVPIEKYNRTNQYAFQFYVPIYQELKMLMICKTCYMIKINKKIATGLYFKKCKPQTPCCDATQPKVTGSYACQ